MSYSLLKTRMTKIFSALILFIASFSALAQNNFTSLNGISGGTIFSVNIDPANGDIYALDSWSWDAYKSSDNGATWKEFTASSSSPYFRSLLVTGGKFYYTDAYNFYSSEDGGSTWIKKNQGGGFTNSWRSQLAKLPLIGEVFVNSSSDGVFVSADGGVTWKKISGVSEAGTGTYSFTYTSTGDVYFWSTNQGIFKHAFAADGNWDASKVTTVLAKQVTSSDASLSVGVNAFNKIYITYRNSANTATNIASSTTGSAGSFTNIAPPASSNISNYNLWSLSPAGKLNLVADGTLYELTDELTPTWTTRSIPNFHSPNAVISLAWKSSTEVYAGSEGTGVSRSINAGGTWTFSNGTFSNAIQDALGSDIEVLLDGTIVVKEESATYGVWTSIDQGASFAWQPQSFQMYGARSGQKLVKLQDNNSLLLESSNGTVKSTNGSTWIQKNPIAYKFYVPVPGTNDVYGLGPGGYGKSTDLGETWSTISVVGLPVSYTGDYAFYFNGSIFLSLNNNSINKTEYWKLNSSGTTWVATKLVTPIVSSSIDSKGFFTLNNKIYASDGNVVAISSDAGVNWTTISYPHNRLLPIRQLTGGIGISVNGNLLVTQDDGRSWRSFGTPGNGTVQDIAQDAGNNFYAASWGGPVSKLSGNLILPAAELPAVIDFSWQPLNGPYGGLSKKLLRNSAGQLFSVSSNAIYRYNTVTTQWDRLIVPGLIYDINDVTIDGTGKLYLISSYQLFTSTNDGSTWMLTPTTSIIGDMRKMVKASNGNLVMSTGGGMFLTTNDGITYTKPATASSGSFGPVAVSSTGNLLTAKYENGVTAVMKSTDSGATWSAVSGIDLSNNKEVFSITSLEGGAMAVVTTDNIYKTTNGGTSWVSIKGNLPGIEGSNKGFRKVYFSPSNNQYYFSNYTALYSSSDGGVTWTKRTDTSFLKEIEDLVWINTSLYAGTQYEGVHLSTNDGSSFSIFQTNKGMFSDRFRSIVLSNSRILISGWGGQFFKSDDGGLTFSVVNSGVYTDYITKLPNGNIVAYGGAIAVSSDGGNTWVNQNAENGYYSLLSTPDGINYYAQREVAGIRTIVKSTNLKTWTTVILAPAPAIFNIESVTASSDGTVYYSGYNGATVRLELYQVRFGIATLMEQVLEAGSVKFFNGKIYALSRNGGIYETSDGNTWTNRSAPSAGSSLKITSNGYFFIDNENTGSLWLSRDFGKSWQSVAGFSADNAVQIEMDENSGYAYAVVSDRPVLKSSAILIPNDNTVPVVSTLSPTNTDVNVPLNFRITIKFNEAVKVVSTKKVRLFEYLNISNPVEAFDVVNGAISDNGKTVTFTPSIAISYLKKYFVIVDKGAFTDIFGNSYEVIYDQNTWTFTTLDEPDVAKPVLTYSASNPNLETGTAKVFELTVIDNKSISSTNTRIYYRGIGSLESTPFSSAPMTLSSGGTATNTKFTATAADTWYDNMGLEFYFEAEDNATPTKNKGRAPSTANTYYYSYIKFVGTKPKITGLSFGETESSYKIISIPHNLVDNQISTIFNELGEANKANWRLLSYAGTDVYDQYPDKLKSIGRGKGYWILMKNLTDIFVENSSTPENNRTDFLSLQLQPGWNMVGNPYTVPISWEEVKNNISSVGSLKVFKGGEYIPGDILDQYEGGFVFVVGTVPVPVKVRFKGITSGGRKSAIGSDLSASSWEFPIHIKQGELGNQIAGVGMNENAFVEQDTYDDFNPPPLNTRVEINFRSNKLLLAKSVVPTQEKYVWKFEATAEGNDPIELRWSNKDLGENYKELFLLDEEDQTITDMRSQSNYVFEGNGSRNFKLYFGENLKDIIPSVSMLGNPSPNPSTEKVTIPFTVSESSLKAHVRLEIYNSLGARVAVLQDGDYAAGFYKTEWNHQENNLTAGLYFCRMITRDVTGKILNQTKKIIVNR